MCNETDLVAVVFSTANRSITDADIQTLIAYGKQNPSQLPGIYQTLQTEGATSSQLNTFANGVVPPEPSSQAQSGVVPGLTNLNTGSNTNSKRSLKDLD